MVVVIQGGNEVAPGERNHDVVVSQEQSKEVKSVAQDASVLKSLNEANAS